MDRPGYIFRCHLCGRRIATADSYVGSSYQDQHDKVVVIDRKNDSIVGRKIKCWVKRYFDPEWVLLDHINKAHK